MGQYFMLVNVDKRENESFLMGKLGEFLFGDEPDRIFYHLLRRTVTFKSPCDDDDSTEADGMSTSFPKFPAEIVAHIFDEIDKIGDCFCLALTSKRCWLIGQPRMKTFILNHAVQWAGDRLICVGDYLKCGDLPKSYLSAEEEEMLDQYREEPSLGWRLRAHCDVTVSRTNLHPDSLLDRALPKFWCTHPPPKYLDILSRYISVGYRKPEILRNISKRQYVRYRAFDRMRKICPTHWRWEGERIDFGHAVLSRICWSSDPSVSMSYKGNIHRGVWAGDRFDITDADALDEKDENGQSVEWTDVTREVLKEMFEIWFSEYGRESHHLPEQKPQIRRKLSWS